MDFREPCRRPKLSEILFQKRGTQTDILLDLQVDEGELITPPAAKAVKHRDEAMTIWKPSKNGSDVYYLQTKPVSEYYKSLGKYVEIDGIGTIDEISGRISAAIEPRKTLTVQLVIFISKIH